MMSYCLGTWDQHSLHPMSYGVRKAQELPQVLIHHLHQTNQRLCQLQALRQVYVQATNVYMHKTEFT